MNDNKNIAENSVMDNNPNTSNSSKRKKRNNNRKNRNNLPNTNPQADNIKENPQSAEAVTEENEVKNVDEELQPIEPIETKEPKKSRRKKATANNSTENSEKIIKALGNALDENEENLHDISQTDVEDVKPKKILGFKRKMYFTIGVIVTLMSIVGFAFTISYCVSSVRIFTENTKQKAEFEKFIFPVVINDPPEFDTTSNLSSETMLTASIWDIIMYTDTTKYEQTFDMISIPASEVDLHATKLFGSGLTFVHKTLGSGDIIFYFNEETKLYTVPVSPDYFSYKPVIEELKKDGNTYTLKVAYEVPVPSWKAYTDNYEVEIAKHMEYTVTKDYNKYTITSIKRLDKIQDN